MNSNACQFYNQSSSCSSSRIRNRYLNKLGILPDGPRTDPRAGPRIVAAASTEVSTSIMKMISTRGRKHRAPSSSLVGQTHTFTSHDASTLLGDEGTPRERTHHRTSGESTDVGHSRTSIFETSSALLVEEEIPEISLKGLAFISSRESILSFPTIVDEDNALDEDDYADEESFTTDDGYDDVKSFAGDEDYEDVGGDYRSFAIGEDYDDYESLSYYAQEPERPPYALVDTVQQAEEQEHMPPRVVHFRNSVTVYEIPSHREYDEISRNSLWNSFQVQEQNVRRNLLEFSADQSDWRQACEEVDMIPTRRGELVHPATWKLICERMAYLQNNMKEQVTNNNQLLRFAHHVFAL